MFDAGSSFNFQIGVGTSSSDELSFNVVTGGEATGFTSQLLGVSADTAASIGNWAVKPGVGDVGEYTTEGLTIVDPTLEELSAGSYRLYVNSQGSTASAVSGATVTVRLKDMNTGEWVTIGTGSGATSLSGVANSTGVASVDLGIGLKFDVGDVDTASSATEAAEASFLYSHTGNKVGGQDSAQVFMDLIDVASDKVSKALGYIGATVNRMDYQEASLSVAKVNTEASFNRIMNADMAFEQVEATKWAILQQTAVAMLAQANMAPQSILGLFR